jgi:hypothetical protein
MEKKPRDPNLRLKAEMKFVREGKTCREIAAELGASLHAVEHWSRRGNWVLLRREQQGGTSRSTLDVLKRQRELLISSIGVESQADAEQIDMLHKLTMSIEKMESRMDSVGPILDVMGRFAEFVASRASDEDCRVIRTWIEKYFDELQGKSA